VTMPHLRELLVNEAIEEANYIKLRIAFTFYLHKNIGNIPIGMEVNHVPIQLGTHLGFLGPSKMRQNHHKPSTEITAY
jgi:hypothetical protein